jgi:hypothetical protein
VPRLPEDLQEDLPNPRVVVDDQHPSHRRRVSTLVS